jgi:hypothetical protein
MSHIHGLGAYSTSATEYQEYLCRLRLARTSGAASGAKPTLTFDSAIDPDRQTNERQEDELPDQQPEQESQQGSPEENPPDGHELNEQA